MLIEVILLLFLLTCCLSGYRKGLIMSLGALLILVLSSLGATVAQEALAPRAVEAIEPKVQQVVREQFQRELEEQTQESIEGAGDVSFNLGGEQMNSDRLMGMLGALGISMEAQVAEGTTQVMGPVLDAAAQALARSVVEPVAELVIYLAAFLILYLLLHSLTLALNVVDRLPVIHTLNRAGGAVLGLLGGFLVLVVLIVVCRRTGWLPEDLGKGPLSLLFRGIAERLA